MNKLIEISLGSSLLITLLLLTAPLLSKRYSAKWRYWVWLILAVRLLLPFNLTLPSAPVTLSASQQDISFQLPAMDQPQTIVALPANTAAAVTIDTTSTTQLPETASQSGQTPFSLPTLPMLLFSLWLLGAASFLLYHLIGYVLFWKNVRRYGRASDIETLAQFTRLKANLKISKNIKLILHPKLSTPMMAGFLRPALLLPCGIHPDDLSIILTHELIHYKRRDLWYKALLLLSQSVHWFNPLVHLMARAACRDIETSCDEQILRGSDLDTRRRYGETLLRTIRRGVSPRTSLCTNFYGGKNSMKHRFLHLFDLSKKKTGIALLSIIVATALLAGTLISCSRGTKPNDLIQKAEEISVTQYSYFNANSNNSSFISFSSNQSSIVQGIYTIESLRIFDKDFGFEFTDNTFAFGDNNIGIINGVNTLMDGTVVHSLPLKGIPLKTEAFSFQTQPVTLYSAKTTSSGTAVSDTTKTTNIPSRTFSGKVYLSLVNRDGQRRYQYTYSLSDGTNDVMISFYAPDNSESRKESFNKIASSLNVTGSMRGHSTVVKGDQNSLGFVSHHYTTPNGFIRFSTPTNWDYDSGAIVTKEIKTIDYEKGTYTFSSRTLINSSIRDGEFDYDEYLLGDQKIAKFAYLSADEPVNTYELEGSIESETELTVGKASDKEFTALHKGNQNAVFKEITGTLTITEPPGSAKSYQYTYAFPIGSDTFLIQFYTTEKEKSKNLKLFENLLSKVRYVQTTN